MTRRSTTVLLIALAAVTLAGCGGSSSDKATGATTSTTTGPTGEPIKLMVETSLTGPASNVPEVVTGAKAAAKAVNDAGGIKVASGGASRPLEIVVCDDRNDPNQGAVCAKRAVDEGVLAMVGNESLVGANYFPVVEAAGLPVVGELTISPPEFTSALSFPFSTALVPTFALLNVIRSAGATGLHLVLSDTPASTAFIPLLKKTGADLGLADKGVTLIPPTATDYSAYAAKAAGAHGGIMLTLNGPAAVKFLKALVQQGVDLHDVVMATGDFLSPQQIASFNGAIDGLFQVGTTWPATYTRNAGVRRYNREVDTYGNTSDVRNGLGIQSWAAVHVLAKILPSMTEISRPALVKALSTAGPIDFSPVVPFDWSTKAVSSGLLSSMRTFSDQVMVSRVKGGKTTPVVDHFVGYDETTTFTR